MYPIENVPFPPRPTDIAKALPFDQLAVGQSFFVPEKDLSYAQVKKAIHSFARRHRGTIHQVGRVYLRSEEEKGGTRVYRIG